MDNSPANQRDGQFSATPQSPTQCAQPQPAIDEEAYCYALECLLKGNKPGEIRSRLMESGHSATQADRIVQTAMRFKNDQEASQAAGVDQGNTATRNMLVGGGVCALGIVITLFSFAAASNAGGGSYVVAWGAIVFGAIQFFRGYMQSLPR